MLRKLTRLITNNFGLKIMAAVFAVAIWMIVVNTQDPEKTTSYTIPVSIENQDTLTAIGKTYEILNDTDQITIWVTAKRSVLEELSESDFTATANLENLNEDMTAVPITVTAARYSSQIEIQKRTALLQINVENLVTEQFKLQAVLQGEPASGCYVDEVTVTPEKVTVTGPESIVNQIETAQVSVSVDRAEENIATNGAIVLLDAEGTGISQERLTLNRTVAAVDVVVLMGKSVKLDFVSSGTPPDGYRLLELSSDVTSIGLTGPAEVLDSVDTITIQADQLNVSNATGTYTAVIDLTDYIPDGASIAEGESNTASVTVKIEGQSVRTFEMPVDNITVQNLEDGLSLSFSGDTVSVSLSGFEEELDEIRASDLKGTLDASSLSAGTYSVAVSLQGNYTVSGTISASVVVSGGDETQGETENTETDEKTSQEE